MAYSFLTHVIGASGNGFTTSAIDTTGADLLIACPSPYAAAANTYGGLVVSDSKGNTWNGQTVYKSTIAYGQIWWCRPTTVGTGHTFSVAGVSGTSGLAISMAVMAFSGSVASPYDVENGAIQAAGSSAQPGSVTPSQANSLVICMGAITDGSSSPYTINSSFNVSDTSIWPSGGAEGVLASYLIQTSASAVNPTVSYGGTAQAAAAIAVFKPSGGATAPSVVMVWS